MEISFDDVEKVTERFSAVLQAFPDGRRQAAEQIAAALLGNVRGHIGGAGKVRSWQGSAVGDKTAGYAAVHPNPETWIKTKGGKKYAVGHVTNAINLGHRTRGPTGKSKRYRYRGHMASVPGKGFYDAAGAETDAVAWAAAEALVERLARQMEE